MSVISIVNLGIQIVHVWIRCEVPVLCHFVEVANVTNVSFHFPPSAAFCPLGLPRVPVRDWCKSMPCNVCNVTHTNLWRSVGDAPEDAHIRRQDGSVDARVPLVSHENLPTVVSAKSQMDSEVQLLLAT